jgi:hypothetical protein
MQAVRSSVHIRISAALPGVRKRGSEHSATAAPGRDMRAQP